MFHHILGRDEDLIDPGVELCAALIGSLLKRKYGVALVFIGSDAVNAQGKRAIITERLEYARVGGMCCAVLIGLRRVLARPVVSQVQHALGGTLTRQLSVHLVFRPFQRTR